MNRNDYLLTAAILCLENNRMHRVPGDIMSLDFMRYTFGANTRFTPSWEVAMFERGIYLGGIKVVIMAPNAT
jgi:hypothetical protein